MEQRGDGIAIVRMNWPEKRNALGPKDTSDIGDALQEAGATAALGVIFTGTGAFCAGGDLEEFAALSADTSPTDVRTKIYENVHSVLRAIRTCPVPVVAAVDGPAVGLGFDYALAADMCFIGPEGWMQQGWAIAGLIHGAGGSAFVQRAAGGDFWRLVADQDRLDGPAAAQLGLAEVADGGAVAAAVDRLGKLSRLPRAVLEASTALFREQRWPSDEFFDRCADFQSQFIGSAPFRARAAEILTERSARARRGD